MVAADWGSVAEWVSGVGSAAAFIAAMWAVRYSAKAVRLQAEHLGHERELAAEERQREMNAARIEAARLEMTYGAEPDGVHEPSPLVLRISNTARSSFRQIHVGEELDEDVHHAWFDVIRPGESVTVTFAESHGPRLDVEFQDAYGRRWVRHGVQQDYLLDLQLLEP